MLVHPIQVTLKRGEYTVIAQVPIKAGAVIVTITGRETQRPNRNTLQVGLNLHLEAATTVSPEDTPECDQWRFLNHCCQANAYFRGRALYALEDIPVGEEVTFNYNATEYRLASPFFCWCDHGACSGGQRINGFADLSPEEQQALLPWCQDHIRAVHGQCPP